MKSSCKTIRVLRKKLGIMAKNKSTRIPNGTIVQTRDEHFHRHGASRYTPYSNPNHPNPNDYYRTTIVVDTNKDDELALVKKTTCGGRYPRNTYGDHVEVLDYQNEPIKHGNHFKVTRRRISKEEVNEIRKRVFKSGPKALLNRKLVHKHVKKRR